MPSPELWLVQQKPELSSPPQRWSGPARLVGSDGQTLQCSGYSPSEETHKNQMSQVEKLSTNLFYSYLSNVLLLFFVIADGYCILFICFKILFLISNILLLQKYWPIVLYILLKFVWIFYNFFVKYDRMLNQDFSDAVLKISLLLLIYFTNYAGDITINNIKESTLRFLYSDTLRHEHLVSVHFILTIDPVQQLSANLNTRDRCQDPAVLLSLRGQPAQQCHLKIEQVTLNCFSLLHVIQKLMSYDRWRRELCGLWLWLTEHYMDIITNLVQVETGPNVFLLHSGFHLFHLNNPRITDESYKILSIIIK